MSAPKKISIVYLAFFLCVICAVATAALAFVANTTAAPIAKAKEAKVFNGLKTVLPAFDNDLVKTKKTYIRRQSRRASRAFSRGEDHELHHLLAQ